MNYQKGQQTYPIAGQKVFKIRLLTPTDSEMLWARQSPGADHLVLANNPLGLEPAFGYGVIVGLANRIEAPDNLPTYQLNAAEVAGPLTLHPDVFDDYAKKSIIDAEGKLLRSVYTE